MGRTNNVSHQEQSRSPTQSPLSGSSTTAGAGVRGVFPIGAEVEVRSDEEGFRGSWYEATIAGYSPHRRVRYEVIYSTLVSDDDRSLALREIVWSWAVRPRAPKRLNKTDGDDVFEMHELVEAYHNEGWWQGIVTKLRENESGKFTISFPVSREVIEFSPSEIRPKLEFVKGKWILARKESDHDYLGPERRLFKEGAKVEVGREREKYGFSWFPATVLKIIGSVNFMIQYENSTVTEILDSQYLRPPLERAAESDKLLLYSPVEVFYEGGWSAGVIAGGLSVSNYMVNLKVKDREEMVEFDRKLVRVQMQWNGLKWIRMKRGRPEGRASQQSSSSAISNSNDVEFHEIKDESPVNKKSKLDESPSKSNGQDFSSTKKSESNPTTSPLAISESLLRPVSRDLKQDTSSANKMRDDLKIYELRRRNKDKAMKRKDSDDSGTTWRKKRVTGRAEFQTTDEPLSIKKGKRSSILRKALHAAAADMENIEESSRDNITEMPEENLSDETLSKTKPDCPQDEAVSDAGPTLSAYKENSPVPNESTIQPNESRPVCVLNKAIDNGDSLVQDNNPGSAETGKNIQSSDAPENSVIDTKTVDGSVLPLSENSVSAQPEPNNLSIIDQSCFTPVSGKISLPFMRTSPLWQTLETMEIFTKLPQSPHFTELERHCPAEREGKAIGLMVTFAHIASNLKFHVTDDPSSLKENINCLDSLENHGIDVQTVRSRLTEVLKVKTEQEEYKKKLESFNQEMLSKEKRNNQLLASVDLLDLEIAELKKKLHSLHEKREEMLVQTVSNGSDISRIKMDIDEMRDIYQQSEQRLAVLSNELW